MTLNNTGNTYAGTFTLNPNTVLLSQAGALPAARSPATGRRPPALNLLGGTVNIRNDGTGSNLTLPGYGNNVTVSGPAVLSVDRVGTTANTNNVVQLGTLALNNVLLTATTGNGYQTTFAGTTTVAGANAGINASAGGPINLSAITGAGTFNKYGTQQVNVTAPSTAFTGGTTVQQGTLRVAPAGGGASLGTGPLAVRFGGSLQTRNIGHGNTGHTVPRHFQNEGLITPSRRGQDFSAKFLAPAAQARPVAVLRPCRAVPARPQRGPEADGSFRRPRRSGTRICSRTPTTSSPPSGLAAPATCSGAALKLRRRPPSTPGPAGTPGPTSSGAACAARSPWRASCRPGP